MRGKRSEAVRRFELYRGRMRRSFGLEPDFDLEELERAATLAAHP